MYEGTMSPADMAAVVRNGNNYDGMGFGGGAWWWIIILFLFGMNGGWGFGGNGGENAAIQRGFDQNSVMNSLGDLGGAINNGFTNVQTALCNGFAGVNQGFANAQMANMNQMFALSNQLNAIAMNQQQNCYENRAATSDLKYTVATEACADRAAVADALNVVMSNVNMQVQSIKDQMCQDKIDSKNEKIADLERQLALANLASSQSTQTARILADNAAQTAALEQYLNPAPIPAYVVQNPNCCAQGYGCGM